MRPTSMLKQLLLPILGFALLIATLVWGTVIGQFPFWLLAMGGVAVGMTVLGLAWQESGRLRDTLASVTTCFFVLLAGIFLYLIVANHSRSFDLTKVKRHTLSEQTVALLHGLEAPVRVVAFVEPKEQPEMAEFFEIYTRESQMLRFEMHDPAVEIDVARQYADSIFPGDMFAIIDTGSGERRTRFVLHADDARRENILSNAILKLDRGHNERVYFTVGKGERRTRKPEQEMRREDGDMTMTTLAEMLEAQVMPVAEVNLSTLSKVPDDAAVVVIVSPATDLFDAEREMLIEYLDEGGSLLITVDPQLLRGELKNLRAVMNHLGVDSPNEVLIEPSPTTPMITMVFAALVKEHAITRNAPDSVLRMNLARPIQIKPDLSDNQPTVTPLLVTHEGVWTEDPVGLRISRGVQKPDDKSRIHQYFLGATSTFPTPGGSRGDAARAVVFGDADFLCNELLTNEAMVLAAHSINWMAQRDDQLHIPPRLLPPSSFELTQGRYWTILGGLLLVSLGLLVGGLSYTSARRRMG